MKNIQFPIWAATTYLFFYVILAQLGIFIPLVYLLFALSPVVVIWMVYRVLRDGVPSEKTFEEHFYDDSEYRRGEG